MTHLLSQNSILNWLVSDTERVGTPELHWGNLPESWGVFVFFAVVGAIAVGVFWLYRNELTSCPPGVKRILACLRFAVLLLIVLMLLRPVVTFVQNRSSKPIIAVLRDTSLSISFADKYREPNRLQAIAAAADIPSAQLSEGQISRAEILQRSWARQQGRLVDMLRDKGSIRVIDFSDSVEQVALLPAFPDSQNPTSNQPPDDSNATADDTNRSELLPAFAAQGRGTDINRALAEVLQDPLRLAAIVLISDGQHNGASDPVEIARQAGALSIPISTVPLGDPAKPLNLAISDVYAQSTARPSEPFEIEFVVYAQDVDQQSLQVDLLRKSNDAGGQPTVETVATQTVAIPQGGGRIRASFQQSVGQPGKYIYQVRVPTADGETDVGDNIRDSNPVDILEDKVRVLLIAGSPSWDYQGVQKLLQRDQNISLTCWLQTVDEGGTQHGNERIAELPRSLEAMGQYNVIMMMDPNPDEFDSEWIENLKLFCKRKAGGLLYVAGPKYTADFLTFSESREIRELLPVRFSGDEILESSQLLDDFSNRPGQMLVRDQNLDHPIMAFVADMAENRAIWSELPHIFWSFPALAAKPIAQVLLERGDVVNAEGNQPLLVTGRYGAGTVVYIGFSGTWRWRRVGLQAQYFDRFWIQLTRFLTETRSLSGSRRGTVDVDQSQYEIGDKVTVLVRALDERFEPLTDPTIAAVLRGDDNVEQRFDLRLIPGQEGAYEGSIVAQKPGLFRLRVELPNTTAEDESIDPIDFRVVPPRAETNTPWLNEKLLQDIATASGGKLYQLNQLEQLIRDLPRLTYKTEISSPPVPLWDMNGRLRLLVFLLPVILLTVEWAVRKRYKLL